MPAGLNDDGTIAPTPRGAPDEDEFAVEQFRNFLSWGEQPLRPGQPGWRRDVPPAWWAYAVGATRACPPAGEM